VFKAVLCGLALGLLTVGSASAAINYLVVAPTLIAVNVYALNLSIATSCPAGYLVHRYGLDDLNVYYVRGHSPWTSPTTAAGYSTCFMGVPSSINISGVANTVAGSSYAVSADVTLTLPLYSVVLNRSIMRPFSTVPRSSFSRTA